MHGYIVNHESQEEALEFVTRKISSSVAKIKLGKQKYLNLGNLSAKRLGTCKRLCKSDVAYVTTKKTI